MMDEGEQSFGYGCGRVSDPDGGSCRCGVDVVACEFADFADGGAVEQQDQGGDSGRYGDMLSFGDGFDQVEALSG